jgi:hypothetical protein
MNKKLILEERLVSTFKALCGVDLLKENKIIKEDKVYSSNIENTIKNKIGKNDDDTSKMITIFGLFRNQSPFKEFGDISKIRSYEELEKLYKSWYKLSLIQLLRSKEFLDQEEYAKNYLNAYIENIRSLGQNAQPFAFKNLEKSLIDVVNGNQWLKDDTNFQRSEYSIENPKDDDKLHEDENVVIVDGGSRAKCVTYGKGQSWCISQTGYNMFNSYRINQGATIYFVLQINEPSPEKKLVILNYGKGQYSIADETNTGVRTGSSTNAMSWDQIEKVLPNLKGKEQFFKYNPITEEEKRYHENVQKKYDGDDIIGYVTDSTENLYLNNTMVTPSEFFGDYIINATQGVLTDRQFDQIWNNKKDAQVEEMLLKYLETGIPLNEYQFRIIEKG